jgi:acyl-coenzyme A thioesterase PaaI-like protein
MVEPVEAADMCFACGEANPIGLKINFTVKGDTCTGEFTGTENHVGWNDTIHGGIVFSALDDVTANVLYHQGRKAHTAKCEIRYRKPLKIGETVMLKGWIEKEKGRLIVLKGEARRVSDGVVVADCEASFIDSR